MIQRQETIALAREMSEHLSELSSERLAWLVLKNPQLNQLPEFCAGTLLLTELLSRVWPSISDVAHVSSFGFVMKDGTTREFNVDQWEDTE